MRSSQTTPAIVLRARPYGESYKIVSFLTEDFGKLTGIAKGALRSRRRFVNSLEPVSLVSLHFQERTHSNLAFIVGADLLFGLRRLVSSLERISYASYLVEITDGLISEREENLAVFQHLRNGLHYLEESGSSLRFLTHYELQLTLVLAAHLASSVVYTGQGKVGSEKGAPYVPYQLSQRADFLEVTVGPQTTTRRPIVNSRDEDLCGSARDELARLHVIAHDSNLAPVACFLKIGVLQLVTAMLEAGVLDFDLALDNPVEAVGVWSRDPSLEACALDRPHGDLLVGDVEQVEELLDPVVLALHDDDLARRTTDLFQ